MALIRCTSRSHGHLTPVTIDLSPGDLFTIQQGDATAQSKAIYGVTAEFILKGVSTGKDGSITILDGSGAAAPVRLLPTPAPTLPTPPPEDGDVKRSQDPKNIITILVDKL